MQGLSGDFTTMPLKDVVQYLGNRRLSGKLLVQRAGVFKDLTLSEGSVVSASSNQPREFLGQFLINMGHLTEDQLSRAFEAQRETWEKEYAEAHTRYEQHIAQIRKAAEADVEAAEGGAATNYSSQGGGAPAESGGSLASDEQLAALREKLSGGS